MKAAICYLAKAADVGPSCLVKSLKLLHRNFNARVRYPVLVFVEPDFPAPVAATLSATYPTVTFKTVELFDPHVEIKDVSTCGPGYRRMCHFQFCGIQEHLADLDWYLRLDTDSFILDEMTDPFALLADQGAHYGYLTEDVDAPRCCVGAGQFFQDLVTRLEIDRGWMDDLFTEGKYNLRLFYNNFEVVDLNWWRRPDVQRLVKEVVVTNNIFHWRWGDHVLRTFLLALTVPREKVVQLPDVDYCHLPFIRVGGRYRGVSF